jgi:predicted nucleic acid-binding protein
LIVLDANILVRGVLGRKVRQLVETYSAQGVRFFVPESAFADAEKYLPGLLAKRGKSNSDLAASIAYLRQLIESVDPEFYAAFENDARERLRGRDEGDWHVLATALWLGRPIWSEDTDFFGTGIAVWNTNRIEIFLQQQSDILRLEWEE